MHGHANEEPMQQACHRSPSTHSPRHVRCVGVRGDAWSVMLSPCNTFTTGAAPAYLLYGYG